MIGFAGLRLTPVEGSEGWVVMRPKERHRTGQADIFRSRLDQIVDIKHPLVLLAGKIDWGFLEAQFGAVYTDKPGRPPLPTRLMAGLAILKSMHDLSDEALCDRWVENPYFQLFCGEEFFQHKLPFDRSSITRWRQRMTSAGRMAHAVPETWRSWQMHSENLAA